MKKQAMAVRQFHEKFGQSVGKTPGDNWKNESARRLRAALVLEEAVEFVEACGFNVFDVLPNAVRAGMKPNFKKAVDALADIMYVVLGSGVTFGVDLEPAFAEVHSSNMAKEGGGTRADGKIKKPAHWTPPDIEAVLKQQGWKK